MNGKRKVKPCHSCKAQTRISRAVNVGNAIFCDKAQCREAYEAFKKENPKHA